MNSFWKVEINNKIINNHSEKLVVFFPGINYSNDRPLIDYSKRLFLQYGYDALSIDYGFQVARKHFNKDNEVNVIVDECYALLKEALKINNKKYKEIFFVGKSIGTVVQINIQRKLIKEMYKCTFKNIYLTPIEKTFEIGMTKGLVVTGTADTWIKKQTVEKMKCDKKLDVVTIEGANHSLNVDGNIEKTMDVIKEVIITEEKYILK